MTKFDQQYPRAAHLGTAQLQADDHGQVDEDGIVATRAHKEHIRVTQSNTS